MDLRHLAMKYAWVLNVVLLTGIAYVSASAANRYTASQFYVPPSETAAAAPAPAGAASEYHAPAETILSRDLFQARRKETGPAEGDSAAVLATNLQLKLTGIVFFGEDQPGNLATIQNLTLKTMGVYRAGDTLGDATVRKVFEDKVQIARPGGKLEELRLETAENPGAGQNPNVIPYRPPSTGLVPAYQQGISKLTDVERQKQLIEARKLQQLERGPMPDLSDRVKQVGPTQWVIQKSALDEAMGQNMSSIITQARLIPNFVDEGNSKAMDGFRIYKIQPGSVYQYLGLQDGDVIKSINGEKMDSLEKGFQALQKLRSDTKFALDIERQRQPMNLGYDIE